MAGRGGEVYDDMGRPRYFRQDGFDGSETSERILYGFSDHKVSSPGNDNTGLFFSQMLEYVFLFEQCV